MESLIAPTINLCILIGIMAYYLRAPLKEFVSQRHGSIRHEVETVAQHLKSAQARFGEYSAKLQSAGAEMSALKAQSQQDAADLKQRLIADAKRVSTVVVSDAKVSAEGLYEQLKTDLHSELSAKVVDKAEKLLKERLTGDDHSRIRREFSMQVESIS